MTTGHSFFMCDSFCSSISVATCTCGDALNPYNKTVWRITNGTQNVCNMTLNQTAYACNGTSATCPNTPGLWAISEPPLLDSTPCDTSTLYINTTNKYLERIQIECIAPNGISYGSARFSKSMFTVCECVCMCVYVCVCVCVCLCGCSKPALITQS